MKRLGMLVMAILLITGCNAIQPNVEEAELLWTETEKNIQKWVISTKAEISPAVKPRNTPEPTVEIPPKTPELDEKPAPQTPAATPSPEPAVQESAVQPEQPVPTPTEQPEEDRGMIDWPYPAITCPPEPEWPIITCPPEPETTPETDWPYITVPGPPTYTPEPEPTERPQEEPTPTPQPNPIEPIAPTPEPTLQPTEPPATPTPEPPAEQPSSGYAECSCGTRLTPEELVPHMKAHAMNGENHSYRAY